MELFPEPWELISAFESEPEVLDPDVPWAYNTLRFKLQRGGETLHCEIQPGYGEVWLRWMAGERGLAEIELKSVSGIEVLKDAGSEHLAITTLDSRLLVQLAPAIRLMVTGTSSN